MNGLVVDLFAGGGGASAGLEAALGRPVDVAVNHDATAIAVHERNHPATRHLTDDVWKVDPREATGGAPVAVLWASPDCTHFSVAKGGKPRKKNIRSLAWRVVDWARDTRPEIIFLENVAEFRGWGPLDRQGHPIRAKKGFEFNRWKRALERLGYEVDYRVLDASLYGAPTRRKRLFLIARRDGLPIRWPEPTHGPGRLPLHTAAECIDWSIPCPSIFERKRPLAAKTLWRIAEGIRRYVLQNPEPFVVGLAHGEFGERAGNRSRPLDEPIGTVHAGGGNFAVVTPSLVTIDQRGAERAETGAGEPLPTTVTKNRHALIAPTLVQTGYGERTGQAARALDLQAPIGTLVDGQKHGLVAAFLAKHFGDTGQRPGSSLDEPVSTITASDHNAPVVASLVKLRGECSGAAADEPLPTIAAQGNHVAEVRAFLVSYYGQGVGQELGKPARTLTTKDRLGLVTIHGVDYQIVDIGMRMLEPHELLRAQFGRFADGYDLSPAKTKSAKVRLIGNSVCPEIAEAIVRANLAQRGHLVELAS